MGELRNDAGIGMALGLSAFDEPHARSRDRHARGFSNRSIGIKGGRAFYTRTVWEKT